MLYLAPGVFSIVLLGFLWSSGSIRHPQVAAVWCLVGVVLQFRGEFGSPLWLVGLAMSVVAAIYFSIRYKLG